MSDHDVPIGPAPEGWHRFPGCKQVIPHTEGDPQWNRESNAEHYGPAEWDEEPLSPDEVEQAWQPSPLGVLLWELATAEMQVLQRIANGPDHEEDQR